MATLFGFIFGIGIRVVFGCAVNGIVSSKGYRDSWFLWGFFFTWIALIVAMCKPSLTTHYADESIDGSVDDAYDYFRGVSSVEKKNRIVPEGPTWTCKNCGLINPAYTGSCSCGASKYDE